MAALGPASFTKITLLTDVLMCFLGCTSLHCLPLRLNVYSWHNVGSWRREGKLAKLPGVVRALPVDDDRLDVYSRHLGLESCKQ